MPAMMYEHRPGVNMQYGRHRTQKITAISVVASTTIVIASFHSSPSGMKYAYLHWSKLNQLNHAIKLILVLTIITWSLSLVSVAAILDSPSSLVSVIVAAILNLSYLGVSGSNNKPLLN